MPKGSLVKLEIRVQFSRCICVMDTHSQERRLFLRRDPAKAGFLRYQNGKTTHLKASKVVAFSQWRGVPHRISINKENTESTAQHRRSSNRPCRRRPVRSQLGPSKDMRILQRDQTVKPANSSPATRPRIPCHQKNRKASFRRPRLRRFQSGEPRWREQ